MTPTQHPPRVVAVMIVVGFGSLATSLMQSLVIPIQSDLPRLLDATASSTSWVITATLLSGAVAMPVTGRLADLYGRKQALVGSAVMLLSGSLIAAFASSVTPLIVGRVFQGAAMGYIPVAISMVRTAAPLHLRNAAVAGLGASLGVGGALGLPLSAWIAQEFNWHLLFWVSAALATIMIITTLAAVPHVREAATGRFDFIGALGLTTGLVAVLVGVSKGNAWGWSSLITLGTVIGGAVILVAWGWYEMRHSSPLVNLRTSVHRTVLLTNMAAILIGFGMMAQIVAMPQLLQAPAETGLGMDQSILQAGLWMAPSGLMLVLFTPVSARMLTAFGGRITMATGAAFLATGYVFAVFFMDHPWELMVASCISFAGVGLGYAAMPTLILTNVPAADSSASVGLNSLMRSVGTALAGAVLAIVLASSTTEIAADLPPVPSASAFTVCFIIGACAGAAGAAMTLCISRERVGKKRMVEQVREVVGTEQTKTAVTASR